MRILRGYSTIVSATNEVASWTKTQPSFTNVITTYLIPGTPSKLCKRHGKVLKYLVGLTAKH